MKHNARLSLGRERGRVSQPPTSMPVASDPDMCSTPVQDLRFRANDLLADAKLTSAAHDDFRGSEAGARNDL